MIQIISRIEVTDFDEWRSSFEAQTEVRRSYGSCGSWAYRNSENPDEVIVVFNWDSATNLRRFLQDPEVQTAVQRTNVGRPDVFFVSESLEFSA